VGDQDCWVFGDLSPQSRIDEMVFKAEYCMWNAHPIPLSHHGCGHWSQDQVVPLCGPVTLLGQTQLPPSVALRLWNVRISLVWNSRLLPALGPAPILWLHLLKPVG
jgi:hypothetical protein